MPPLLQFFELGKAKLSATHRHFLEVVAKGVLRPKTQKQVGVPVRCPGVLRRIGELRDRSFAARNVQRGFLQRSEGRLQSS